MIRKLNPVDLITLVYASIIDIFIIYGWSRIEHPLRQILLHFSIILLILGLTLLHEKFPKSKFVFFFRLAYPLMLYGYFFESVSHMNLIIFHDYIDVFFQKIDFSIFGYQPTLYWGTHFDTFFLQELFHFSYFSYYLMFLILTITLFVKSKYEDLEEFIFTLSFVFYFCFITYVILPVIGGRYFPYAMEITQTLRYGIFTKIMAEIYIHSPHLGGAFPSSHVAIAIVLMLSALKYEKKLALIFIPITILLSISTVYCHYHYFIDVLGGISYVIIFYPLSFKLYSKLMPISQIKYYEEKNISYEKSQAK